MKGILKNPWLASGIGAILFALTCVLLISKRGKSTATLARAEATPVATTAVSWDFRNPELELIMSELKKEKESLANRERGSTALLCQRRLRQDQHERRQHADPEGSAADHYPSSNPSFIANRT